MTCARVHVGRGAAQTFAGPTVESGGEIVGWREFVGVFRFWLL